jgi:hypothetical protein
MGTRTRILIAVLALGAFWVPGAKAQTVQTFTPSSLPGHIVGTLELEASEEGRAALAQTDVPVCDFTSFCTSGWTQQSKLWVWNLAEVVREGKVSEGNAGEPPKGECATRRVIFSETRGGFLRSPKGGTLPPEEEAIDWIDSPPVCQPTKEGYEAANPQWAFYREHSLIGAYRTLSGGMIAPFLPPDPPQAGSIITSRPTPSPLTTATIFPVPITVSARQRADSGHSQVTRACLGRKHSGRRCRAHHGARHGIGTPLRRRHRG